MPTWQTSLDSEIGTLTATFEYDYDSGEPGDGYLQPPVYPSVSITSIVIEIEKLDQYSMQAFEELIIDDHETK